jgi:hypothetical protein
VSNKNHSKYAVEEDKIEIPEGNFKTDIPLKITTARLNDHRELLYIVEWDKRSNGIAPLPTVHKNSELRSLAPLLLVDYYESKMRFGLNINNLSK